MKHFFSLLLLCQFAFLVHAQVFKTVELTDAGNLGARFLQEEKNTVTNLKVSGSMDARDFKFIRDSLPSIAVVDFGNARILAYSGDAGTDLSNEAVEYKKDEVPPFAFVRSDEFANRGFLKKVVLSRSATSIGSGALALCTALDTVHISELVKNIEPMAFTGSSAVFSVDPANAWFRDSSNMLYDKTMHVLLHCPITVRGDLVLPSTVDTVAAYTFYNCKFLKSLELPKSVELLGSYLLFNCSGLTSLKVNTTPDHIKLSENVFSNFSTDTCILWVPFGKMLDFRNSEQWSAFLNLQEHSNGMVTNKVKINLLDDATPETFYIRSNVKWTIVSDQDWLMLDKTSGRDSDSVVVSATPHLLSENRVGHLLLTSEGLEPITLTVTQSAKEVLLHVESGGLANRLKAYDRFSLMMLKLDGTMDVRDFLTLNDSLPMLTSVDLSNVRVTAWKLTDGYTNFQGTYEANALPLHAFDGWYSRNWSVLSRVILPESIRSIASGNFRLCISLKEIRLPDSVVSIGSEAFLNCISLSNVTFGASVSQMGDWAFANCRNLSTMHFKSEVPIPLDENGYVFDNVNVSDCALQVPFGTKKRYAEAPVWNAFSHIVEGATGFYPEAKAVRMAYGEGSEAKVSLRSTVPWTVQCNQSWLQVTPTSGTSSDTLTMTAQVNLQTNTRLAVVTLTSTEFGSRILLVTQAAYPKTLQMKAGELSKLLTSPEMHSLSNLTLAGTMDGRDFRILRDSLPLLNTLDLRAVSILKYEGSNATSYTNPANTIPAFAFFDNSKGVLNTELETVYLPESVVGIGDEAFQFCEGLKRVSMPDNLQQIGSYSFMGCSSLTSIQLPKNLKSLGTFAFSRCTQLSDIQFGDSLMYIWANAFGDCKSLKNINLPESLTIAGEGVFSNCTSLSELTLPKNIGNIGSTMFLNCTSLSKIVLNNKLETIGYDAFRNCSKLVEINLPSSIKSISYSAFGNCASLKKVVVNALNPMDMTLEDNAFGSYYLKNYTLYVPYLTKVLYAAADPWKNFGTIVEAPSGLKLSDKSFNLSEREGSSATVHVQSNATWTVRSDQPWLNLSVETGTGNDSVKMTATANTGLATRNAVLTFQVEGVEPQQVLVSQEPIMKYVTISAGGLSAALTTQEKQDVGKLTIRGVMDARDFKTLRENLPNLSYLYLGETTVAAYSGIEGTNGSWNYTYPANSIPDFAFYIQYSGKLNEKLQKVVLPNSITAIGRGAFFLCRRLDSIQFPSSVKTIAYEAFEECRALKSVIFPEGLTTILSSFRFCSSLKSIVFPRSVTMISNEAFSGCYNLTSMTILQSTPPNVGDYWSFYGVDRQLCTLYVPAGTKERYAAADVWKDFYTIVETSVSLGMDHQSSPILYPNPFKEVINIQGLTEEARFTLTDMHGKTLLSKEVSDHGQIRPKDLARGVYLVRLVSSKGTLMLKMVKD